jgi:hypothetical protein
MVALPAFGRPSESAMNVFGRSRDHPRWLEMSYQFVETVFRQLDPVIRKAGYHRADRWIRLPERIAKQMIFDCQMCGQCTLHSTGMTCPMTCPKDLRNGPCGGVRRDKTCEVLPDMNCVWVEAYERSTRMGTFGAGILLIQPPLNHRLAGESAFINLLSSAGDDMPPSWSSVNEFAHERK